MRKRSLSLTGIILGLILALTCFSPAAYCADDVQPVYGEYSDETGYFYFVDDEADLFGKGEEAALEDVLKPIADKYGNAGIVTIDEDYYNDTEDYADVRR